MMKQLQPAPLLLSIWCMLRCAPQHAQLNAVGDAGATYLPVTLLMMPSTVDLVAALFE